MAVLRRLLRALASLAGLGLVAAVPAVLWAVYRGPITREPWSDSWGALARGELRPVLVVALLSAVVALAWLRVAVALVVEMAAALRGRPAPTVRGLGSGQRFAALLVGGLTAVTVTAPRFPATEVPRANAAAVVMTPSVATEAPTGETWRVPRRTTLWALAEQWLGDGARWRDIIAANQGHDVAPGLRLDESTRLVHAGWQLQVPAGASVNGMGVPRQITVQRGDTLSGLARRHLGDSAQWPAIWDLNRDRVIDGRRFDDPNLILPGWVLDVPLAEVPVVNGVAAEVTVIEAPAVEDPVADGLSEPPAECPVLEVPPAAPEAPAPPAPAAAPEPSADAEAAPPPPEELQAESAAAAESDDVSTTTPPPENTDTKSADAPSESDDPTGLLTGSPVPLGAALLLAVGAVGLLDARRRQRLRRATVGSRLPEPAPAMVGTELRLRAMAESERVARLDLALRCAAVLLAGRSVEQQADTSAVVLAVLAHDDGQLELMISGEVLAVSPFTAGTSPDRWTLAAEVDLADLGGLARTSGSPCPTLVQVGTSRGAALFVDVEAWGTLGVEAPPEQASVLLAAMVSELSLSPFAQQVEILTVGLEGVGDLPRVVPIDDAESALEVAVTATTAVRAAAVEGLTTFTLRARAHGETWEPYVVVLAEGEPEGMPDGVPPGQGLAVLAAGRPARGCWLTERDGSWWLEPLGLPLVPVGAALDEIRAIRAVLEQASLEADAVPVADEVLGDLVTGESVTFVEPEWQLMVSVLGGPEVRTPEGDVVSFDRSKSLELVVWLSQHRTRATRSGARTSLWDVDVRDATFANVVSEARRAMARCIPPPEGEEWVGRTLTEDLPLHRLVVTDVDMVAARVRHAAGQDDDAAVETLRPAVDLLRGMPFEGTAYAWADAEGVASNVVLVGLSAAVDLGRRYLALGDLAGVFDATARGLQVLPGHEELLALRMRAHAMAGDLAGVRAEWAAYERSLATDPWADDPSEKLVALRRELLATLPAPSP